MGTDPLDALEAALGDTVRVRLKSGESFEGVLSGYDQHMNLVLEDVQEGPTDSPDEIPPAEQDITIIRGDNVVSITP